jgi:hypothetical protein
MQVQAFMSLENLEPNHLKILDPDTDRHKMNDDPQP